MKRKYFFQLGQQISEYWSMILDIYPSQDNMFIYQKICMQPLENEGISLSVLPWPFHFVATPPIPSVQTKIANLKKIRKAVFFEKPVRNCENCFWREFFKIF